MTHSLHRQGTEQSLERDYVLLVTPAANINHEGTAPKLKEILDYVHKLGPSNIGGYETGSIHLGYTFDQIREGLDHTRVPRLRCCFSDFDKVRKIIKFIKEKDYGLSVTVSGLVRNVHKICEEQDIKPHSINLSLGFHGRTDLLPSTGVMELVTMCGHGMVSVELVKDLLAQVKSGGLSPREAAVELSKPCVCGIFNTDRAEAIFQKIK